MTTQTIKYLRRLPEAVAPTQATPHAAGFDLVAATVTYNELTGHLIVDTGLTIEVPEGHVLYLFGRSGQSMKYDIHLANGVGVIDSDYRGPLKFLLKSGNTLRLFQEVKPGTRVGQAILMPLPKTVWTEVGCEEDLSNTERGEGGFGSSGR